MGDELIYVDKPQTFCLKLCINILKTIFQFCAQRSWETIYNNFLGSMKIHGNPPPKCFQFSESCYIFSWHWKPITSSVQCTLGVIQDGGD